MTKDQLSTWVINIIIVLMAAAIPFGLGMALYTGNTSWLMLCGFLLLFLS